MGFSLQTALSNRAVTGVSVVELEAEIIQLKRHLHQVFGNGAEVEAMDHNGEGKLITAYIDVYENNI